MISPCNVLRCNKISPVSTSLNSFFQANILKPFNSNVSREVEFVYLKESTLCPAAQPCQTPKWKQCTSEQKRLECILVGILLLYLFKQLSTTERNSPVDVFVFFQMAQAQNKCIRLLGGRLVLLLLTNIISKIKSIVVDPLLLLQQAGVALFFGLESTDIRKDKNLGEPHDKYAAQIAQEINAVVQ